MLPNILDRAVISRLFVEVVPFRWAERLAAGQPPSMFYSIKGDVAIGSTLVRGEIQLDALDGEGRLIPLGVESKTGIPYRAVPTEGKSPAALTATEVVDNAGVSRVMVAMRDGQPVLVDARVPAELPGPWNRGHLVKWHVSCDPALAVELTGVEIRYKDVRTADGLTCADMRLTGSYAIVQGPPRAQARGGAAVAFGGAEKFAGGAAYQAAARRPPAAVPAAGGAPTPNWLAGI